MERRYGQKFGRFLILDPRSTFLDPRSSFLDPRSSFLGPRSSILDHRSSFLDPRSTFLDPRSSFLDPQSTFLDPPSSSMFPDHRSTFLDPPSTFPGPILDTRLPSQCTLLDPRSIPLLFCACAVSVARDHRPRQREAAPITLKLGAEEIRKQWRALTLF